MCGSVNKIIESEWPIIGRLEIPNLVTAACPLLEVCVDKNALVQAGEGEEF